jgi:hypothetical protein
VKESFIGEFAIFLVVFFSIYGGLHLYAFIKIRRALTFGAGVTVALVLFMAIMIFAPVIVRISERFGFEFLTQLLAYIGYTWMGLLLIFVSVAFALDIFQMLLHIGSLILQADLSGITLSNRHPMVILKLSRSGRNS